MSFYTHLLNYVIVINYYYCQKPYNIEKFIGNLFFINCVILNEIEQLME